MTQDLVDRIWSAIQRPSPAVTRDEIAAMVKMHAVEAPVEASGGLQCGPYRYITNPDPGFIAENNSDLMRLRAKKPREFISVLEVLEGLKTVPEGWVESLYADGWHPPRDL